MSSPVPAGPEPERLASAGLAPSPSLKFSSEDISRSEASLTQTPGLSMREWMLALTLESTAAPHLAQVGVLEVAAAAAAT